MPKFSDRIPGIIGIFADTLPLRAATVILGTASYSVIERHI